MKKEIILSTILILLLGISGTANATSLFISPASSTQNAGTNINASIKISNSGTKVCAVEGTLVFNNVSCQSITLSGNVTPQTSPTCSNPYFLIGIPSCTTSDVTLMTVSAKAVSAGLASINLTNADIIGEGLSVGSTSTGGSYTINAIPVPTTVTPQTTVLETEDKNVSITEQVANNEIDEDQSLNVLTASLVESGTDNKSFFVKIGGWIASNIIWIIILFIFSLISFIFGKKSAKINLISKK
jgi:hypothetical protein